MAGALLHGQSISTAARQADLNFVANQLPALHANLFYQLDRAAFQQAASDLGSRMDKLTDAEFYVQLEALTAMAGDAHTVLFLNGNVPQIGFRSFPLQFRWLDDGVFVTAAASDYARAAGARLVQIAGLPIDQAMQKLATIIPHDNDQWLKSVSQLYLAGQQILQGLDIAPAGAATPMTFRTLAGDEFTLNVGTAGGLTVFAPSPADGPMPDYVANPNAYYWLKYLPEQRLVYFKYNHCDDDPMNPFAGFTAALMRVLDTNPVDSLVFDFRGNPGGSTAYFENVFAPQVAARLPALLANPKFRIYDAIDKGTFSSGLFDAMVLKSSDATAQLAAMGVSVDLTGRVFVIGEAGGGKPSSYGEVQPFTLPGSKLAGQYSTAFVQAPDGIPDGPSFVPDISIGVTSTDYFARHDPVLSAILARTDVPPAAPSGNAITLNGATLRADQGLAPGSYASVLGAFPQIPDEVRINGTAALLVNSTASQVNFVIPASLQPGAATVSVRAGGAEVAKGRVVITATGPGIFVLHPADPTQPGAVENQDESVNSGSNRAAAGSVIAIFATGLGQVAGTPQVFFGDTPAQVAFSGPVPQYPGIWQINAVAPSSVSGQVPVFIIAGSLSSNGVTVWVH
jgi:uncharacterized protein (TIGR03437 family)